MIFDLWHCSCGSGSEAWRRHIKNRTSKIIYRKSGKCMSKVEALPSVRTTLDKFSPGVSPQTCQVWHYNIFDHGIDNLTKAG